MTAAAPGLAGARSARAAQGRPRPLLRFFLPSFPPCFLPSGPARPLLPSRPCGEWELPRALERWVLGRAVPPHGLWRGFWRARGMRRAPQGSAAAARIWALPGPSGAGRAGELCRERQDRAYSVPGASLLLRLNCSSWNRWYPLCPRAVFEWLCQRAWKPSVVLEGQSDAACVRVCSEKWFQREGICPSLFAQDSS